MLSRFNFHLEIRKRLAGGARLVITDHAKLRMAERSITLEDVRQCLQRGHPTEDPTPDLHRGSTSCPLLLEEDGEGIVVVAAISDSNPGVVVVTTYGKEA